MSRNQSPRTFRPAVGARTASFAIYVAAVCIWAFRGPERFGKWGVLAISVFGALWLLDILLTRIVLEEDCIWFISFFKRKVVPRDQIAEVTWQWGGGVFLKLTNGKSVRLPHTGQNYQGQVNTIRAWLKR